eukprot:3640458-Amphidinium_carterae.1
MPQPQQQPRCHHLIYAKHTMALRFIATLGKPRLDLPRATAVDDIHLRNSVPPLPAWQPRRVGRGHPSTSQSSSGDAFP